MQKYIMALICFSCSYNLFAPKTDTSEPKKKLSNKGFKKIHQCHYYPRIVNSNPRPFPHTDKNDTLVDMFKALRFNDTNSK